MRKLSFVTDQKKWPIALVFLIYSTKSKFESTVVPLLT